MEVSLVTWIAALPLASFFWKYLVWQSLGLHLYLAWPRCTVPKNECYKGELSISLPAMHYYIYIREENRKELLLVACNMLFHLIPVPHLFLSMICTCVLLLLIRFNISLWRNAISIQHFCVPVLAVKLLNKIDPKRKFGELSYWSRSSTAVGSGWPVIICSLVWSFGFWYFLY